MSTPLTDEQLQAIEERDLDSLKADAPHNEDIRTFLADRKKLIREVKRLKAERQRAVDALGDLGRQAVATSGDLEDGINSHTLDLKAERPEPPDWAAIHDA